MDEYDNIRQMPNQNGAQAEAGNALPKLNLRALSLVNDEGHLTITFWLLAAAIVVGIYLVIEMLEQTEPELAQPIVPVPEPSNHATAAKRTSKATTKETAQGE